MEAVSSGTLPPVRMVYLLPRKGGEMGHSNHISSEEGPSEVVKMERSDESVLNTAHLLPTSSFERNWERIDDALRRRDRIDCEVGSYCIHQVGVRARHMYPGRISDVGGFSCMNTRTSASLSSPSV